MLVKKRGVGCQRGGAVAAVGVAVSAVSLPTTACCWRLQHCETPVRISWEWRRTIPELSIVPRTHEISSLETVHSFNAAARVFQNSAAVATFWQNLNIDGLGFLFLLFLVWRSMKNTLRSSFDVV